MPRVAGNHGVNTVNLLPTALNHVVEANVVLKRIGANNVVVVRIGKADGNSACLLDPPGFWLAAYGIRVTLGGDRDEDSMRKPVERSVGARLSNKESHLIAHDIFDFPETRAPLAWSGILKTGGQITN